MRIRPRYIETGHPYWPGRLQIIPEIGTSNRRDTGQRVVDVGLTIIGARRERNWHVRATFGRPT